MASWTAKLKSGAQYEVPFGQVDTLLGPGHTEGGNLTLDADTQLKAMLRAGKLEAFRAGGAPAAPASTPAAVQPRRPRAETPLPPSGDIVGQLKDKLVSQIPEGIPLGRAAAEFILPGSVPAAVTQAALLMNPAMSLPAAALTAAGAVNLSNVLGGHSPAGALAESAFGLAGGKLAEIAGPAVGKAYGYLRSFPESRAWIKGFGERVANTVKRFLPEADQAGAPLETVKNVFHGHATEAIGQQMNAAEDLASNLLGGGKRGPDVVIPSDVAELFNFTTTQAKLGGYQPGQAWTPPSKGPHLMPFKDAINELKGARSRMFGPKTDLPVTALRGYEMIHQAEDQVYSQIESAIEQAVPGAGAPWRQEVEALRKKWRQTMELERLFKGQIGRSKPKFEDVGQMVSDSGKPKADWINDIRNAVVGMETDLPHSFEPQDMRALRDMVGLTPDTPSLAQIRGPELGVNAGSHGALGIHGPAAFLALRGRMLPFVPHITIPAREQAADRLGKLSRSAVTRAVMGELPTLAGEGE